MKAHSHSMYPRLGNRPFLGVRKTAHLGDDWLCFDNFKLLYYGDGDTNKPDDFVSSVEEAVADGKGLHGGKFRMVHYQRCACSRTEAARHLYPSG